MRPQPCGSIRNTQLLLILLVTAPPNPRTAKSEFQRIATNGILTLLQNVYRSPVIQVESHLKILREWGILQLSEGVYREEVSFVALHALSCRCVVKQGSHATPGGNPYKILLSVIDLKMNWKQYIILSPFVLFSFCF